VKVAVVMPDASVAVKTAAAKLHMGLILDGFNAQLIRLQGPDILRHVCSDLAKLKHLTEFDAVIYTGSIPWPSHMLLGTLNMLFVHGFTECELSNAMTSGHLRSRIGSATLLNYWRTTRLMNTVNVYICHSFTTSEANRISRSAIILPQFVLPSEVDLFSQIRSSRAPSSDGTARILTYSSFADSPRLLRPDQITKLSSMLKTASRRRFEITVIDPQKRVASSDVVRALNFMPRRRFLELLASSDIYLEMCLDEELRLGAIEACLLGVPVAKITRPMYLGRQDYDEKQLIIGTSMEELAARITHCMEDECDRSYHSRQARDFIIRRRQWEKVKEPLVDRLKKNDVLSWEFSDCYSHVDCWGKLDG